MLQIDEITSEPKQRHSLPIEGYTRAVLTLEFKPEQLGWFFSLVWEGFETYGERIVASHNILRQYEKIIPFGIAITTDNNQDPLTDDAFSSGSAKLYVLTPAEIVELEGALYGG